MKRQLKQIILAQIIKNPKPQLLNPLLGHLTNSPAPQTALFLYNQMLHHPTSHNHYTFTYALKACCFLHDDNKGREVHARVVKTGHFSDTFIQNSLLHFYVTQADIVSATRVFDSIPNPDVVSWTSMISGLNKCGFVEEAIVKFMSMDVPPNSTTLVIVMSACSSLGALKFGKSVHGYCMRKLSERNVILDNAVLDFYMRCGSLVSARYLFVNMPRRDVYSWTSMVGGYAQRGFCDEAVKLFQGMVQGEEVEPNEATIVNVLAACSSIGALSLGQWVNSYISARPDLVLNGILGNALINMYVKCGEVGMAVSVFKTLVCKDHISWSTIISGMAMNGYGIHTLQLFSLMLVHGIPPDDVTFLGLLSACSHAGLVDQGLMIFNAMKNVYRIAPQTLHYACLVDMYGRAGFLEEAENFMKEMPTEADGVVWGALLNACKIHGNEKMLKRIRNGLLKSRGVSIGTYALISNTYATHERWDEANKVRDEMRQMGLKKLAAYSQIDVDPNTLTFF
ncbi:hypothetical protein ACFX12_030378 [Malus domestica]|nr:pentatricopeptide repeat-containing protein At1g08070, chloroplastic-like [Malus domestica]